MTTHLIKRAVLSLRERVEAYDKTRKALSSGRDLVEDDRDSFVAEVPGLGPVRFLKGRRKLNEMQRFRLQVSGYPVVYAQYGVSDVGPHGTFYLDKDKNVVAGELAYYEDPEYMDKFMSRPHLDFTKFAPKSRSRLAKQSSVMNPFDRAFLALSKSPLHSPASVPADLVTPDLLKYDEDADELVPAPKRLRKKYREILGESTAPLYQIPRVTPSGRLASYTAELDEDTRELRLKGIQYSPRSLRILRDLEATVQDNGTPNYLVSFGSEGPKVPEQQLILNSDLAKRLYG